MAVTYEDPQWIDPITIRLRWSSDQTVPITFRAYADGVLVNTQVSNDGIGEFIWTVGDSTEFFFEVLDKACMIPTIAFSGYIVLNWVPTESDIDYFIVEKWNGSSYDEAPPRVPNNGNGAFSWTTAFLADATAYQYRVTGYDTAGNAGSQTVFSGTQVRHPPLPDVTITRNSGGSVTVAAA